MVGGRIDTGSTGSASGGDIGGGVSGIGASVVASEGASVAASVGRTMDREIEMKRLRSAVSVRPVGSKNDLASDFGLDAECGLVGSTVGAPEVGASVGTAAAQLAMQRLADAQGLHGEVMAARPHRNSLPSVLSVEGLQQREDPSAWMAASDTTSEAAFVGATGRRPEDKALSADYLRRRLGAAAKAPAWLKAVADDVPSTARWWK